MSDLAAVPPHPMTTDELKFHYEKAYSFRVIHVDGAFGSLAPNASGIQMSVYSERMPIPKSVVHPVKDGVVGPELLEHRVVKEGVYREVEATLVMNLDTAIVLRDWLIGRIDELTAFLTSRQNV